MSKITDWERAGIKHFFDTQPTPDLAFALTRVISKNNLTPQNCTDAVDSILLHSVSVHSILNRRAITKEIMFKYLHDNKVSVAGVPFSKQFLIEKILQFWQKTYCPAYDGQRSVQITEHPLEDYEDDDYGDFDGCREVEMSEWNQSQSNSQKPLIVASDQEHFPINQMARNFASWFYTNLNAATLREVDFWQDVQCSAQFLEHGVCIVDEEHSSNGNVLTFCQSLRSQYELYFNLNDSHVGTQGRIDPHGLVLVLSCGTLHKTDQMVGVFECVFGLTRDPFSENNWKINHMRMRLHNNPMRQQRSMALAECETLAPLLSIAVFNTDEGLQHSVAHPPNEC